jgi:serine/threonine protein kinase
MSLRVSTNARRDRSTKRVTEELTLVHPLGPARILTSPLALTPGSRLSVYEIITPIGEGGMGQVYRARDTKLDRDVAIKILPEAFAHDADRLARFTREAKTLAALNHPHIAGIYGLEESGGVSALVMELVEGDDLSQRIARGAIPLHEALPIARQIAEALEAAHEQGIIHRDLKPANVKVREDGTVKVLDFGLAKAMEPISAMSSSHSMSPTITTPAMTQLGMILGTAAYMSPEQARGKTVDKRADIWAFGCVLYEMLAGRQAFEGEDVAETLGAALKTEPDWERLPDGLPLSIRKLLKLCLEKNPRSRRSGAADVRIDLEQALQEPQSVKPQPAARTPSARLPWIVAILASLALTSVSLMHFREAPLELPEMRLEITTPATTSPADFALSPDGRSLAFVASGEGLQRLWIRHFEKNDPQPVPGTEEATFPFWSADGRSIAFFAAGKLKRSDIDGGLPQTLANAVGGRGGAWSSDGTIVFAPFLTGALFRIPASGGQPQPFTELKPGQIGHRFPEFLPDGHHLIFFGYGAVDVQGIYLTSLDGGAAKLLTPADSGAEFLEPDRIVFIHKQTLVARQLDLDRDELVGNPQILADDVGINAFNKGAFSVSYNGMIAYRGGALDLRQFRWYDRFGKAGDVVGEPDPNDLRAPELSPDGRRIALDRTVQGNRDIWLMDVSGGRLDRLTFNASADGYPLWSPNGKQIVFESDRQGRFDLYIKPSSAFGNETLLFESATAKWAVDWSKDGRFLMVHESDPKNGADLWALSMTSNDRKRVDIAQSSAAEERNGQFSPDGRWVAYETNESGVFQIVVQPFPVPSGKRQVSIAGGSYPRWRADGKELYFIAPDNKLMAATVRISEASFESETPVALFPLRILGGNLSKHQYAVSADGRFLINDVIDVSSSRPITLILHRKPAS